MSFRRLHLESLESRRVLAGNVSATVVNGELRIVGDGAANWVQITELPAANGTTFKIVGKPFDGVFNTAGVPTAGQAPTLVNGAASATLVVSGDKLRVSLNGGNDAISIGSAGAATTTKGLIVDTGAGRDYVSVQKLTNTSTAALSIKTTQATGTAADAEVDADTVFLSGVTAVNSPLVINTGGGNDRLTTNLVQAFTGTTTVNTGAGADVLSGTGIDVFKLSLNMGASNDRDVATISQLEAGPTTVVLGGGNDLLNLTSSIFISGGVTVNGGDGTDELRLGPGGSIDSSTLIGVEIHP